MEPISVKAIMQGPRGILFVKNPRGELELPGGRTETGEGLEAALAREVKEECGLNITATVYLGSKSCEIIPDRRVLLVFFRCEFTGQDLLLSEEHTAYEWVDMAAERPKILPEFYWDFCRNLCDLPAKRSRIAQQTRQAVPPLYPLFTGESDRQRLLVTAAIYDSATTEFLSRYLPSEGRILDVGCGHGQVARWMASSSPRASVIGLDISPEQIGLARAAAQDLGLTNLDFRVGDATQLSDALLSEPGSDLIACRFTLLHIKERRQVIQALLAQLSPDGVLIMEEPSLKSLFSVPAVAAFEEANAAIMAFGRNNGVGYDCIEDIWSLVTRLGVDIREARFSQPTVWKKEHKKIVLLSFQQFRAQITEQGLLDAERAEAIAQSLAEEYMDDRVISGGLRTLQIAISRRREES